MPLRKRIHTPTSDRFPAHHGSRLDQVRRLIAAEAARIMVTQTQFNYRIAKQKAAQRLGVGAQTVLPSNVEVETALRAYQEFYGGARHLERLQKMRECALRIMRSLEPFNPRLVGPVLDGTADRHSRITLHLFNDPPDAVAVHLLDRGITFGHEQRKIRWHDGSHRQVPLLITHMDDTDVELNLFTCLDLRQAPPSPVDGRPQKRAPMAEVECLIAG